MKAYAERFLQVDEILKTASPPTAQIQSMSSAFEPHLGIFVDAQDKQVFSLTFTSHCYTHYLLEHLPTCWLRTVAPRLAVQSIQHQSLPLLRQRLELLSPPLTSPNQRRLYFLHQRSSSISTLRVWISVPNCRLAKRSLICVGYRRNG